MSIFQTGIFVNFCRFNSFRRIGCEFDHQVVLFAHSHIVTLTRIEPIGLTLFRTGGVYMYICIYTYTRPNFF